MSTAVKSDTARNLVAVQQRIRKIPSQEFVKAWMQIVPLRMYVSLAVNWMCILVALGAVVAYPAWWMYAGAFVVIGFSQYGLFILGHDGLHWALHPNRKTNDRISAWLVYGPMFMGLKDARRNHLEHHRLLGLANDPDRYLHTLSGKNSRFRMVLFCLGVMTFGRTLLKVTPFGRYLQPPPKGAADKTQAKHSSGFFQPVIEYAVQRIPVAATQPLVILGFWGFGLPLWSYFMLWVAPIYFCVFLPDEIRAFCDHAVPRLPDDAADAERLVTFRPSWIEALIFSPHNMNFHAEHHLWPSVPFYNLPRIQTFLEGDPGITVRGSYTAFLLRLFAKLPLEETELT